MKSILDPTKDGVHTITLQRLRIGLVRAPTHSAFDEGNPLSVVHDIMEHLDHDPSNPAEVMAWGRMLWVRGLDDWWEVYGGEPYVEVVRGRDIWDLVLFHPCYSLKDTQKIYEAIPKHMHETLLATPTLDPEYPDTGPILLNMLEELIRQAVRFRNKDGPAFADVSLRVFFGPMTLEDNEYLCFGRMVLNLLLAGYYDAKEFYRSLGLEDPADASHMFENIFVALGGRDRHLLSDWEYPIGSYFDLTINWDKSKAHISKSRRSITHNPPTNTRVLAVLEKYAKKAPTQKDHAHVSV